MIDKLGNTLTVLPPPATDRTRGHAQLTFAQTLRHPMETSDDPTDTDAAERGMQGRDATPTEMRAQARNERQAPGERRRARAQQRAEQHAPSRGGGKAATTGPAASAAGDRVQELRALAAQAARASPDLDVAALAHAVKQAAGRLVDTASAAREAAARAVLQIRGVGAAATSAGKSAASPGQAAPDAQRFHALMRQMAAPGQGDATTFRVIDGTAGTLEVKVALQGGKDLQVHLRALDPAMAGALNASLDALRRQLTQADLVGPTGTVTVITDDPSSDDPSATTNNAKERAPHGNE